LSLRKGGRKVGSIGGGAGISGGCVVWFGEGEDGFGGRGGSEADFVGIGEEEDG
jgi:hypothetical protein